MNIIKESLFLFLITCSSMSLAATELNQNKPHNLSDSDNLAAISISHSTQTHQSLAISISGLENQIAKPQPNVSHFSADAAAFGEMLIEQVALFNLKSSINPYTFNTIKHIETSDSSSSNSGFHYQFWSMLLVGLMLMFGQFVGAKNSTSDLKLSTIKS